MPALLLVLLHMSQRPLPHCCHKKKNLNVTHSVTSLSQSVAIAKITPHVQTMPEDEVRRALRAWPPAWPSPSGSGTKRTPRRDAYQRDRMTYQGRDGG
jgi:hypothetical protein